MKQRTIRRYLTISRWEIAPIFTIFLIFIPKCQAMDRQIEPIGNDEVAEKMPEIVIPKLLNETMEDNQQPNIINLQRTLHKYEKPSKGGGSNPIKRQRQHRRHSVSRSVNSYRSNFVEHDHTGFGHRHHQTYGNNGGHDTHGTLKHSRRVDSSESGVDRYERMMLTNEGIERAVILVPVTIPDNPKVLTAETFVGGKIKFKEDGIQKKRRRIGKRVEGETNGRGERPEENDSPNSIAYGKSILQEMGEGEFLGTTTKQPFTTTWTTAWTTTASSADQQMPITSTANIIGIHADYPNSTTALDSSNRRMVPSSSIPFPAEQWQLPPDVLMARLRHLEKANPDPQINNVEAHSHSAKSRGGGRNKALTEYLREIGLLDKNSEKPKVYFLIDDQGIVEQQTEKIFPHSVPVPIPISNGPMTTAMPINLRTKFPKNREIQKPIQLKRLDDSDMDLLSPQASINNQKAANKLKSIQHISNNYQVPHGQSKFPQSIHQQHQVQTIPPRNAHSIGPAALPQKLFSQPIIPHPLPPPPPRLANPNATRRPIQLPHSQSAISSGPIGGQLSLFPPPNSSSLLSPNAKLELCCRRQNLPQTCQQFCNFDTFTQEKLLVALLGTQCPASQLGKAFDCAHSKVDHSECCQQSGIHLINSGQCMVFCRTHIPTPPNVLGYVSCLSHFGTIKNCYRDHQLRHRNLFGD